MIDLQEIQIEERNVYSAVKWGIVAVIYFIVLTFVLKIPFFNIPNEIIEYGLLTVVDLLSLSTWVLRILIFIWIIRIARKLNRPMVTWGIFGLIFPPVTLIIIGLQDYKVEDKNIKEIIEKVREDFRAEFQLIKSEQDLSENELNQRELKLKEKYNIELRKKVCDYIAQDREASKEKARQEEIETQLIYEQEENDSTQSESENWINDINKCPACGAKINDKTTICYECGLTIK